MHKKDKESLAFDEERAPAGRMNSKKNKDQITKELRFSR